jgi:hypothetical protein
MRAALLISALTTVAMLSACGSDGSPTEGSSAEGPAGTSDPPTTSDGADVTAAPDDSVATSVATTVATSTEGGGDRGNEFPGGEAGVDELAPHNWLGDDGTLFYGETEPPREIQEALCDYLVGTPDEVADAAGLDGDVTLEDGSGYTVLGGSGVGFRCGYEVDGTFAFGIVLWSDDLRDQVADQPNTVAVALPNELFGATVYAPEWDGTMLDATDSEQWLSEAAGRVRNA